MPRKQPDTSFALWLARVGWDKHGGRTLAAEALGLTTETIRAYALGSREVPRSVLLAMAALAGGLKEWSANG